MNEELKEWLGIKPADFVVYAAGAAVIGMYYIQNVMIDIVLSVIAVSLCVVSCVIGMRPEPRLSAFSNFVKRVGYPGCLFAVLLFIYFNFTRWNEYNEMPSIFWISSILSLLSLGVAASYLAIKKPRRKLMAFIIVFLISIISLTFLNHLIIKPKIKTWYDQREISKRLTDIPSYKEVNKQDIEAAHKDFYSGQYEKAAQNYERALKSASESRSELNYRIGLSHFMAGNLNEALIYMAEAKKQNPAIFKLRTFHIPSANMAPTLIIGDFIICDIEYYRHRAPTRGDVIVFINPKRKDKIFVGRIIGMPEEVIQIKGKETFVNNSLVSDKYANFGSAAEKSTPQTPLPADFGPLKIPQEGHFILGDNRNNSQDSRHFGCVHKDLILGRALAIYGSLAAEGKGESSRPERIGKRIE